MAKQSQDSNNQTTDLQNLTFEQAILELDAVVKELESGQLTLEKSVSLYEKGISLSMLCDAKLKEVEQKIDVVIQAGTELNTKPFDTTTNKGDLF